VSSSLAGTHQARYESDQCDGKRRARTEHDEPCQVKQIGCDKKYNEILASKDAQHDVTPESPRACRAGFRRRDSPRANSNTKGQQCRDKAAGKSLHQGPQDRRQ
jgi:hypothetical protein